MDAAQRNTLFQRILDEHGVALRRLCGGYERNEAQRHELEQEVLLNIWRALPRFRGDASLRTWMYRVAHNTASRHVSRAVWNHKTKASETRMRKAVASNPGPEEAVAQADARARLQDCIGQLRTLDREIILLYLEDLPQTEIAEVTGLSQANVSTRIHRIKGQLKEMMSP